MIAGGLVVAEPADLCPRRLVYIGGRFTGRSAFTIAELKRLRAWLDKAIAWMEEDPTP